MYQIGQTKEQYSIHFWRIFPLRDKKVHLYGYRGYIIYAYYFTILYDQNYKNQHDILAHKQEQQEALCKIHVSLWIL